MAARQVFSFSDWDRNHPGERLPGDRLDAQIIELLNGQAEILARLQTYFRDDGQLQNSLITRDTLAADLADAFASSLRETLAADLASASSSARIAEASSTAASRSLDEARTILAAAQAALDSARVLTLDVQAKAGAALAVQPQALDNPTGALGPNAGTPWATHSADALAASAVAQDYAQVSIEWAEHMPDPIPPNILAVTGVTGDHWSSRWWANKAASTVGYIPFYYAGAGPVPPVQKIDGSPLVPGSIWFDTSVPPGQVRIWNGSTWVPATVTPSAAATTSLAYSATEGQTVFPLTNPDMNGTSVTLVTGMGVMTYVNGARLVAAQDFTVNVAGSSVTLLGPVHLGDTVAFDVLVPAEQIAPNQFTVIKRMNPITPNGSTTTFGLQAVDLSTVNVHAAAELVVSVDGVLQAPTLDYVASGTSITFGTAPAADSKIFMTWFGATAAA